MEKIKKWFKENKKITIIIIIITLLILISSYFIFTNSNYITKEQAKKIVYKKTKLEKDNIEFREIKLNKKKKQYKISFSYNGIRFNYTLNAKTGRVIKNDFDTYPDKELKNSYQFDVIPKNKAKEAVATNLNANEEDIEFIKIKLEKKTASAIYNIKVKYKESTYEYKVDGISGSVLSGYTKKLD